MIIIINFFPSSGKDYQYVWFFSVVTKYVLLAFDLLSAELIPSCKFQLTELLCKGINV